MAQNFEIVETPNIQYYWSEPYVVIIEQPGSDSHTFRYASEISVKEANGAELKKRNAGSIAGVNSKPGHKTYTTIKVMNYQGPYSVIASCVTNDGPPHRPHPHNLIGTEHCKDGVYRNVANNPDMTHSLKNVAIERVKRNDVTNSLTRRGILMIDPYGTGFDQRNIDLKTVRLCFQVFIRGPDNLFSIQLKPVVSDPIYHRKEISHLSIVQLSHFSAPVTGGTKVILLCDPVDKNDIEVWFYEKRGERILWQNKAQFGINDVYRKVAISFETPPYYNKDVHNPVYVFLELRKPSENRSGEPREFRFLPEGMDPEGLAKKRFKAGKMSDWWSVINGSTETEHRPVIGVPRVSQQPSHEIFRDDSAAERQLPVGVPTLSMQSPHEMDTAGSVAGNQLVPVSKSNESYLQPSIPSVLIAGFSTRDTVTESYGAGITIPPTMHLQPAQAIAFGQSPSAHQQVSVTSHATLTIQQIPGTVNTKTFDPDEDAFLEQFNSIDLDPDPGVENLSNLSLSLFDNAQSFLDAIYQDASSSIERQ